MSLFAQRRDPALTDVSDEALQQLTKLLYMDAADYFGDGASLWLTKQEQQVKGLDAALLRPRGLISRFALAMMRRNFFFCLEVPSLCSAHKALDPKVIRSVLQLIADECTIQTNRYRSLRLKEMLYSSIEDWMSRMDSITALWLGEDKFRRVFGCGFRDEVPDCVGTKCEACMLAVIGGSATYLTDLRASVMARQAYNRKLTGRERRRPRLLRVVESWISFFQEDCQKAVRECSDAMVNDIVEMRTVARRRRDKEDERRRRKGKPPKVRSDARVRLTKEGLPIPRQPRLRECDGDRHDMKSEKRMETMLSLEKTVVEHHQRQLDYFRLILLNGARPPLRNRNHNSATQNNNGTAETKTGSMPEMRKQGDSWKDLSLDKDNYEEGVSQKEYGMRSYRRLSLAGVPYKNIKAQSKLSSGANPHRPINDSSSSWTSKVDADSPPIIQAPRHQEVASPGRTASSVYSCDEQVKPTKARTPKEAFSLFFGLKRDPVAPEPMRWVNEDMDVPKREKEANANRRTALAALEGREEEEEAASCYESTGWGGPRR